MKKKMFVALAVAVALVGMTMIGGLSALAAPAQLGIVAKIAPEGADLGYYYFTVTNTTGSAVEADYGTTSKLGSVTVPANGSIELKVARTGTGTPTAYVQAVGFPIPSVAQATESYYATIQYMDENNAVIHTERKEVAKDKAFRHTAVNPYQGTYELVESEPASRTHDYKAGATVEDRTLVFKYRKIQPKAYDVTIGFVDVNGNALGQETRTVQPGTTLNYTAPGTTAVGNATYELAIAQDGKVTHVYGSNTRSYTVVYSRVADAPEKSYYVYVYYMDADTGLVLATKPAQIPVGATVTIPVNASIIYAGNEFTKVAGEPAVITHAANNPVRTYTVQYSQATANAPYDITINYANALTGAVVESQAERVNIDATVQHTAPATLMGYTIAEGEARDIVHSFTNNRRVYTVYYNADGANSVMGYDITVQYIDAATSDVLGTATVPVGIRQTVSHVAPLSMAVGDATYYLAAGQGQVVTYTYGTAARLVNVFYRTTTAEAEAEIPVINPIEEGPAVPVVVPPVEPEPDQDDPLEEPAVPQNPGTDDGEEEEPEAEEETTAPVEETQFGEGEVALSAGGPEQVGPGGNAWIWIILAVTVCAMGILGFALLRKRSKGNA